MTYFANISDTIFFQTCNNIFCQHIPNALRMLGNIYPHTHTLLDSLEKYCVGYVCEICHVDTLAKRILGAFWMLKSSSGSLAKTRNNAWQQRIQSGTRCGFVIAIMVVSAESRRDKVFKIFQDPNVSRMSCKYVMFMCWLGDGIGGRASGGVGGPGQGGMPAPAGCRSRSMKTATGNEFWTLKAQKREDCVSMIGWGCAEASVSKREWAEMPSCWLASCFAISTNWPEKISWPGAFLTNAPLVLPRA